MPQECIKLIKSDSRVNSKVTIVNVNNNNNKKKCFLSPKSA